MAPTVTGPVTALTVWVVLIVVLVSPTVAVWLTTVPQSTAI